MQHPDRQVGGSAQHSPPAPPPPPNRPPPVVDHEARAPTAKTQATQRTCISRGCPCATRRRARRGGACTTAHARCTRPARRGTGTAARRGGRWSGPFGWCGGRGKRGWGGEVGGEGVGGGGRKERAREWHTKQSQTGTWLAYTAVGWMGGWRRATTLHDSAGSGSSSGSGSGGGRSRGSIESSGGGSGGGTSGGSRGGSSGCSGWSGSGGSGGRSSGRGGGRGGGRGVAALPLRRPPVWRQVAHPPSSTAAAPPLPPSQLTLPAAVA